jgi:hypothetical protein
VIESPLLATFRLVCSQEGGKWSGAVAVGGGWWAIIIQFLGLY